MGTSIFCGQCGTKFQNVEPYCSQCGQRRDSDSSTFQSGPLENPLYQPSTVQAATRAWGKTKKTALRFAIFLSFWSWSYTYSKDSQKFWIGLGGSVLAGILYIASAGTTTSTQNPESFADWASRHCDYHQGLGWDCGNQNYDQTLTSISKGPNFTWLYIIIILGIWIWSMVDRAAKSERYYTEL